MDQLLKYYGIVFSILEDRNTTEIYVSKSNSESPWLVCENVNDIFYWACGDAEIIELDDLDDWVECHKLSPSNGDILWASRKRRMRPQGPIFTAIPQESWHLFSVFPERKTGLGNPCQPGEFRPERLKEHEPSSFIRDSYPSASSSILDTIHLFTPQNDLYDLGIPRVDKEGNVVIVTFDNDLKKVDEFTPAEWVKLMSNLNCDWRNVPNDMAELRALIS